MAESMKNMPSCSLGFLSCRWIALNGHQMDFVISCIDHAISDIKIAFTKVIRVILAIESN